MDTDLYKVDIAFDIKPYWKQISPLARIRLDTKLIWDDHLEDVKNFELSMHLQKDNHVLEIELYNKSELDSDQGLEILNLQIGRIHSQLFVWQGLYRPRYPEPWATEQKTMGIDLKPELQNTNYLGWNGTWTLPFSCPIFTWIHQVENLGWIYD